MNINSFGVSLRDGRKNWLSIFSCKVKEISCDMLACSTIIKNTPSMPEELSQLSGGVFVLPAAMMLFIVCSEGGGGMRSYFTPT